MAPAFFSLFNCQIPDLSMLRRMGNPVAINPNKELILEIKADEYLSKRIQIIVERKNVIYKCSSEIDLL